MAVDATQKYRLHPIQKGQIIQALLHTQYDFYIVFLIQFVLIDELFHPLANVINHRRRLRRKYCKVPPVRQHRPKNHYHDLSCNRRNTRQQITHFCTHQANHNIQQSIRRHRCQNLAVDKF